MVKRLLRYFAITFLAGTLVLLVALVWLLQSESGARWLVNRAAALLPEPPRIEQVTGSVAAGLDLAGIHYAWPGGTVDVERLRLRWSPSALLHADLQVSELTLAGVTVNLLSTPDAAAAAAPRKPWTWPVVSGWPLRVAATVERLQLERVALQADGAPLAGLAEGRARLGWHAGVLELSELAVAGPRLAMQGESRIGFAAPAFSAGLSGSAPGWAEMIEGWSVAIDLRGEPQALDGTFRVALTQAAARELTLQGNIALDTRQLRFAAVHLARGVAAGQADADATIALDDSQPLLRFAIEFRDVDLSRPFGVPTRLSGRLELAGEAQDYRGAFRVANAGAGWRQGELQGTLRGNLQGLQLSALRGSWLRGRLSGRAGIDWSGPLRLETELQARALDAGDLLPVSARRIDLDLAAHWQAAAAGAGSAELNCRLRQGEIAGSLLAGELALALRDDDLWLTRLDLQGAGLQLQGSGRLQERLAFTLALSQPQRTSPPRRGSLTASAWLSRRDGRWAGAATLAAQQWQGERVAVETLSAAAGVLADGALQLQLDGRDVTVAGLRLTTVTARGSGSLADHRLQLGFGWEGSSAALEATGGVGAQIWQGRIERCAGSDSFGPWQLTAPVAVTIGPERFSFSPLHIEGGSGETLNLSAEEERGAAALVLRGDWQKLQLARLSGLSPGLTLRGESDGVLALELVDGRMHSLQVATHIAAGSVGRNGRALDFTGEVSFTGNETGQQAALALATGSGGSFRGEYASTGPLRGGLLGTGTLQAHWTDLPLQPLLPAMASGLRVTGGLSGELTGRWFADRSFELTGRSTLGAGAVNWQDGPRQIDAPLRTVELAFNWRDAVLSGTGRATLGERGQLDAELQLPLPARLPLQLRAEGALSGRVQGFFTEQGALGALLPGLVKESRGRVEIDLTVAGTPARPEPHGSVRLQEAGGYLPGIGIRLEEGACSARIEGETLQIENFTVKSGAGRLSGEGSLTLAGWKPTGYRATFKGERVQLINLPELLVVGAPDLTVSGTPDKLSLQGTLLLSEVRLRGRKGAAPQRQSDDVVLVETQPAAAPPPTLAVEAEVKVTLGSKVLIELAGIDARVEGEVLVRSSSRALRAVTGAGKLEVKEGSYTAYGVKLDIDKGVLLFSGGPIEAPTLDVIALREVDEIKAGVRVGGTPQAPTVKLYSEPSLQDTDILSYIVFGQPLSADTSQLSMLSVAAATLLAQSGGTSLQGSLLKKVGVDAVDVSMPEGTVESSVVTVGKYLTPDLYISLGHSVFAGTDQLQLRYDLDRKWQLESTMGDESAVDIYYKFEFD